MTDLKEEIEKLNWPQLEKVLRLFEKQYDKRITSFIDDARISMQEYEADAERNVAAFNKIAGDTVNAHNLLVKRIDDITNAKLPTREEITQEINSQLLDWTQQNLEKYQQVADGIQTAFKKQEAKIDRYRTQVYLNLFISMLHSLRVFLKLFPLASGIELSWKMTTLENYDTKLKKAGWIMFASDGDANVLAAQIFKDGKPQHGIEDFVNTFSGTRLAPEGLVSIPKRKASIEVSATIEPELPVDPKKEEEFALNAARAVLKSDKLGFLDEKNRLTERGKEFLRKVPENP